MARPVDRLFLFLCLFTLFLALAIALTILYFAIRYRRRPERPQGDEIRGNLLLELSWTVVPTIIALFIFYFGAKLYFQLQTPPAGAMEIHVVAKQWMWKFQHLDGQAEMDELHIPVGRDIKLILATEDVIHSFFVPAFRVKADVVPGRYRSVWFRALRPGAYHLFCAEYCGTNHSGMGGYIIAMNAADYQAWLQKGRTSGSAAAEGEKLFSQLACNTCHLSDRQGRAPVLGGLYGRPVPLRGGQRVIADEDYLHESILAPEAKIVAGFDAIMPSFRGLLSEEQVLLLVAYIKSLEPPQVQPAPPTNPATPQVLPTHSPLSDR